MKPRIKTSFNATLILTFSLAAFHVFAQPKTTDASSHTTGNLKLFIDVHEFEPGKVSAQDLAQAHAKDLAVEGKYGVQILKYWVDENKGRIFCLASAPDSAALLHTHAEAHGMLPSRIYEMSEGMAAKMKGNENLFLDIHYMGAGNVSTEAVAGAHQKDLAVEKKYGVNFIDYWVDQKEGVIMCLAQAKDSTDLIKTHKEAHGLLLAQVFEVTQKK